MSQSLADLLPQAAGSLDLRLWLKASAYTRRLLLGHGADPWESASKFLAYFSQAQGLLRPDVAVLEIGELYDSWLVRHPQLKDELTAKRKLSYPLRRLLELDGPRSLLLEVIEAVVANLRGQTPLVLSMPSPRYWVQRVCRQVGRDGQEVDEANIEDAAMYVADLMRAVSGLTIGGLMLEEATDGFQTGTVDLDLYRPLINVAKHYRWPLVLRQGNDPIAGGALDDFDVVISTEASDGGKVRGVDLGDGLWSGIAPPLVSDQFYFVEIPEDARPEAVLEQLAELRA